VEEAVDAPAEPSVAEDRAPPLDEDARPPDPGSLQDPEESERAEPERPAVPDVPPPPVASPYVPLTPVPPLPEPAPVAPDMAAIEGVLSGLHCALVEGDVKDGLVEVRGHAAATSGDWVRELRALPGVRDVVNRIAPLSTVHCLTLDVFASLLRAKGSHALGLHTASRLRDGDSLQIDVAANASGFLYIDYFSADGTVVHLLPRPNVVDNRIEQGTLLRLGRGGGSGAWAVGPPFGTEMITAIVAPEPLFATEREELELAFSYREDLKRALEQIRRRSGIGSIDAAVSFVAIEPRPGNDSR
jgi:eukaryotic-like serine/threonine-protein kinase